MYLGLVKFAGLAGDRRELREALRTARSEEEKHGKELDARDAELQVHRDEIQVLEHVVGDQRDSLSEMEAERRESESARHYQGRARDELTVRLDVMAHDLEDLSWQRERALVDSTSMKKELSTSQETLDGADQRLRDCGKQAKEAGALLMEQREALEKGKDRVLKLVTGLTRRRAVIASKTQRQEELVARTADLGESGASTLADLVQAREALAQVEADAATARERMSASAAALETGRDALKRGEVELSSARKNLGELDLSRLEAEREVAADEARLRSLEDLQSAHADLEDGARALLESVENLGTVAEHLDVPEALQERVELVLGTSLSHLVFSDEEALLVAANAGQDGPRMGLVHIDGAPDLAGWAAGIARDPVGAGALARLLAGWEEAPDLSSALDAWKRTGRGVQTPDGSVVGSDGVVFVGRQAPGSGAAVLRRQREITELSGSLELSHGRLNVLRQEAEDARSQLESLSNEVTRLRDDLETLRSAHRDCHVALAEADSRVREERAGLERQSAQAGALEGERASISGTLASLASTLEEEERGLLEEETDLADTEESVATLRTEVMETEDRSSRARELLARAEAEQESARDRVVLLKNTLVGVEEQLASAVERFDRLTKEREEAISRVDELGSDDVRLNERIQELGEQQGTLRSKLKDSTDRLKTVRDTLSEAEESLRGLRDAREAATTSRGALELQVQEARLHIENLREQVEERYQVSLPGLLDRLERDASLTLEAGDAVLGQVPMDPARLPEVADLVITPDWLEERDKVEPWVRQLSEDRRGLERLGEVNLAALEEYEDVIGRYNYLEEQRLDLEESVESIRKAIAKINRTCRERFKDAYDLVSGHFERMYPALVGGGQARLILTDEEDLLETGVEIFVQPPGKRLQNLELLSGGEKAMTAIALIFSLFMVKPSPFCLLDEVDAPLDEGNGGRFNDMLKEMSERSQFIVITHNKKTMEAVDTLYGVTMPDPGVSRLVTVQIH